MGKLKKSIIILAIIVGIILLLIFIINSTLSKNETLQNDESDVSADFIKTIGIVEDYSTFFSVEKMLNNYIIKAYYKDKEAVYNFLDTEFIEENKITQDNVLDYIIDIGEYETKVKIREMYSQVDEENAVYFIKCVLGKNDAGKKFYFELDAQGNNYHSI